MKTLLFFIFLSQIIFAEIIPQDNRIDWAPGVPGGITEITSPVVNVVADYSADSTGNSDSKTAIQNAINSLKTTGGVVYFPQGKYKIDGSLEINYNGIVLRGDGPDKSKLNFYNLTKSCIEFITYGRGDWQGVSGYTKGVTSLTVDDGSKFTVGEFAEIQQENDSAFMYTDPNWNQSYAQNLVNQILEVSEINGNEIHFKTPLHITFQSKFNPEIRPQRFIMHSGIENLYLTMKTNDDENIILFKNAAYCWAKNIVSYHSTKAHIASESTIGCEVRESQFSKSHNYGGGGHGYGVSLGYHTVDWLVENNVFDSLRHAMIFSKGTNGSVISYNYSQDVLQGEGETNLNDGWIPPDISSHGHYAFMNLIEGNSAQEVGISDYWGPSGPGNTYFRNRILSGETQDGISYYDVSTKQNVIGNSAIVLRDADGNAFDNLEHGNTIDDTLSWDSGIADHNLPNSYYLTEKPSFFGSINWPLYGPTEGYTGKLPAQLRFEGDTSTKIKNRRSISKISLSVYPNPFNPITTISFNTNSINSSVKVYDIKGREIMSKNFSKIGQNNMTFNGTKRSSGIYFVKAMSGTNIMTKKIILLK